MKLTDLYPIKLSILYSLFIFTIFLIKGDKAKFRLFLPTCFLAGLLDLWTDLLTTEYPLWQYTDPTPLIKMIRHSIHPLIAYFYTVYLFLQWLPSKNGFIRIFFYITAWVCWAGLIEYVFHRLGEVRYVQHWGLSRSILMDYVLYLIFYFHHIWFRRKSTICS